MAGLGQASLGGEGTGHPRFFSLRD